MEVRIIAAIPTRGALVTECIASVHENLKHLEYSLMHQYNSSEIRVSTDMVFTWDKKLPDGHNETVKQALKLGATHIWMVEEDVIVPPGTLLKMLQKDEAYVVADYPEKSEDRRSYIARYPVNDPIYNIYWSHTGCTLIKREIFEKFPYPWFENQYTYEVTPQHGDLLFTRLEKECDYGGHDLVFGVKMREAGLKMHEVPVVCTHARLIWNNSRDNDGRHTIEKYSTIGRPSAVHDIIEDRLVEGSKIDEEDLLLANPPR